MLKFHRKLAANPNPEWIVVKTITINSILKTITTKKNKNLLVMMIAVRAVSLATLS
jgi:hypothetical protein